MEENIQDRVNEFKTGEWFKRYSENKKEFLGQLRPLSSYSNIDWKVQDANTIIEFCASGGEIGAINVLEAFAILYCCELMKCKAFVEIGRFKGRSTRLLAVMAKRINGIALSIDGRSSKGVAKRLEDLNLLDYVVFDDSWSPWVNLPLPMDEIDFLFIDGDHSFMSVIVDYHFFNYFVKKGGIIGFHDLMKIEVQEAVAKIIERDNLEELCRISSLRLYRKTQESRESYWQLLTHHKDFDRKKLHDLQL